MKRRLRTTPTPTKVHRKNTQEDSFLDRTDSEYNSNEGDRSHLLSSPSTSCSDDQVLLPLTPPAAERDGETPSRGRDAPSLGREFPRLRSSRRRPPPISLGHEAKRPRLDTSPSRPGRRLLQAKLNFTPNPQLASTPSTTPTVNPNSTCASTYNTCPRIDSVGPSSTRPTALLDPSSSPSLSPSPTYSPITCTNNSLSISEVMSGSQFEEVMQQVDRIIIARHGKDVSTPELGSERADLVALVSPSSSLSPAHTPGTEDSAHPGSLIPPTSDQMDLVALASPSSSLSHAHTPPAALASPSSSLSHAHTSPAALASPSSSLSHAHTSPAALASPSSSLSHAHTSPADDFAQPGSLIPPTGDQLNLAVLASPSSSLSHAHTSPAGVLTPPTGDRVNSAALSSNPSPVITNSQITRIMIDLYHSPAHASVGDSDSEAMDTLPASNGDREVLPEGTRRGSSATDLSVGQNSNYTGMVVKVLKVVARRFTKNLGVDDSILYYYTMDSLHHSSDIYCIMLLPVRHPKETQPE